MRKVVIATALALLCVATADAQTISLARARAIALRAVSNNEGVKSEELKTRDGIQVYEFDIETPGAGHQEVRVNARTGAIVANKHEDDVVGGAVKKTEHAAKKAAHATEKAAKKVAHETDKAVDKATHDKHLNPADYRISESEARTIALRRHGGSGATVKKSWLDEESGTVVWRVKIETNGKPDDHEIMVNATTGAIVEHKH